MLLKFIAPQNCKLNQTNKKLEFLIKNQILEPIINNTETFYQEKQFKKPQKCLVESIFLGGFGSKVNTLEFTIKKPRNLINKLRFWVWQKHKL